MRAIVVPAAVVYTVVVLSKPPACRFARRTVVAGGAPSAPGELTPYASVPPLAVAVAGADVTSRQSSVPVGGVITVIACVPGSSSQRPLDAGCFWTRPTPAHA